MTGLHLVQEEAWLVVVAVVVRAGTPPELVVLIVPVLAKEVIALPVVVVDHAEALPPGAEEMVIEAQSHNWTAKHEGEGSLPVAPPPTLAF